MTKPIDAIIIDDEELARKRIRLLLSDHSDFRIVGEASTGEEALKLLEASKPDIIFLDISLPGLDGFSILEQSKTDLDPVIVVVSGSEEHALRAFDYYAFDYLLKPFKDSRFNQSIAKIRALKEEDNHTTSESNVTKEAQNEDESAENLIPVKHAGRIQFIRTTEIKYIEASGYYVEINTDEKKHLLRESMSRIIKRLDREKFVRVHRSAIINLEYMKEITRSSAKEYYVKMNSGKLFKVSKSYKKALFNKLNL